MKKKLGELLVASGDTTEAEVAEALGEQRTFQAGRRLGDLLVERGRVEPDAVAKAIARQVGLPYVELRSHSIPSDKTSCWSWLAAMMRGSEKRQRRY